MQNGTDDMTKRMTISVDDDVYEILETWADEEVRTVANLAAALVTMAARDRQTPKKQSDSSSRSK
ncbi:MULTISPECIES: ribbon-helix-helix domain-containing protein [Cyanophyceae]|nr:hypothetical protein [Phormidium sp. FACHB-592]